MPLTDPRRFRLLLLRAILVPLGLLLLLAAVLLWEVKDLLWTQEEARRSQVTLTQVERVRQLFIDRETGVRGYLLTGDAVFLEPYQAAEQRLPQALEPGRHAAPARPDPVVSGRRRLRPMEHWRRAQPCHLAQPHPARGLPAVAARPRATR